MDGDREAGEKPRRTSTLKNVLIVAAILGVLVILTLAGGLVWMVRIARESVATRQQALIATNTDFPFTPPADGRMSEEQFQSWMRVARQLEDLRQAHAAELGGSGKQPSLASIVTFSLNAMSDLVGEIDSALRGSDMSLDEFGWISHQLAAALRHQAAAKRPGLAEIIHSIGARPSDRQPPAPAERRAASLPRLDDPEASRLLDLIERSQTEFEAIAPVTLGDPVVQLVIDRGGMLVRVPPQGAPGS